MPRGDRPQHDVRKRPRKRDQSHAAVAAKSSGGTKSKIIHRNRLAPGDSRKTKRDQDEQHGADRVEVHSRVEADAAQHPRRVVAEHPGGPGVHELVNGDGDDEGHDDRDKLSGDRSPRIRASASANRSSALNRLELRRATRSLLGAGTRNRGGRPRSGRCPDRQRPDRSAGRPPSHTGSACGSGSLTAG